MANFRVAKIVKCGLLVGYKIVNKLGEHQGYEWDEDEKHLADSKCDLMNLLNS